MSDEYYIIGEKSGMCIDYLKSLIEVTAYEVTNEVEGSEIYLKKISFYEADDYFNAVIIISTNSKQDIEKIKEILTRHKYSKITITHVKEVVYTGDEDEEE